MTSLRIRLTLFLLLATVMVAALVGWLTFEQTLSQNKKLFDYQLKQTALTLRDKGTSIHWEPDFYIGESADTVAQVLSADGTVRYRSDPGVALPKKLDPGFNDVIIEGMRWRIYSMPRSDRVIQVAQPWEIRRRLALAATFDSLAPMLAFVPAMVVFIWWLIGRELRPLRRLEREVVKRHARSMDPVSEQGLPSEVAPVAHALNRLLGRLRRAFHNERAFISDAAHELRSPVTALQLQLEMLEQELAVRSRPQSLDELSEGVKRISRLIEQLLTAASTDHDEETAAFKNLDLVEAMRRVIGECFAYATERHIDIRFDAPDSMLVHGDAHRLRILMRNLLDNAIRYTPEHGVVAIRMACHDGNALLSLDDSGPGIPESERCQVFRRFYRGRHAGQPGSGLGLAIVRNIATLHQARIALSASDIGGLRVEVSFPMTRIRSPQPAADNQPQVGSADAAQLREALQR
ncbi:ATP-binding protein [Noviherbaspirillum pedocola]|uniref:histidine kinase n=1 Tax=Noviherbaspirillum pedocola TaxID=2801341 RepID=A0A934SU15_9BURK|nr:ATP-binding protein [Noviherbaspirillum pedocola]MBK4736575.1 two-component sensor histidine kinase [Noviherbaspirillum pedocola]